MLHFMLIVKTGLYLYFLFFFFYFNLYIYPPDSQESDGGAIHRASNMKRLLNSIEVYHYKGQELNSSFKMNSRLES